MSKQAAITARNLFGVDSFPQNYETIQILDMFVNAEVAEDWMRHSDPRNPNNEFVRTVSEFAVHFGDTAVVQLGGAWRYARAPNYFESTVMVNDVELYAYDILMKKCSDDFTHESLTEKYKAYTQMVKSG